MFLKVFVKICVGCLLAVLRLVVLVDSPNVDVIQAQGVAPVVYKAAFVAFDTT